MAKTGQQTSNRSEARANATGAGQTSGSGRRPKPEDNTTTQTGGDGGTETSTEQPMETPIDHHMVCIATNPKRPGSIAYRHFENYYKPAPRGSLTNVVEARKAGVRGKDLSWDRDPTRRHILVGQEALDFCAIGDDREKQAEFLKGIGVPEKSLIKWGYMDAPVAAPAEEVKEPEAANA